MNTQSNHLVQQLFPALLGGIVLLAQSGCADPQDDLELRSYTLEPIGESVANGSIIGVTAASDGTLSCVKADGGPWNSTGGGLVEFYLDAQFFTAVEYPPQPKVGGTLFEIEAPDNVFDVTTTAGIHSAQCIAYPYEEGLIPSEESGFEDCGGYACTRSKVLKFKIISTLEFEQTGYCKAGFPGQGNGVQDHIDEHCPQEPAPGAMSVDVASFPYLNQNDIPDIGWAACSSASAAMVLAYDGKIAPTQEAMISAAETIFSKTANLKVGLTGAQPYIKHLESYWGYSSVVWKAPNQKELFDLLLGQLEQGRPVILGSKRKGINDAGHYMVVLGVDSLNYKEANIIIADPNGVWTSYNEWTEDADGLGVKQSFMKFTTAPAAGIFILEP